MEQEKLTFVILSCSMYLPFWTRFWVTFTTHFVEQGLHLIQSIYYVNLDFLGPSKSDFLSYYPKLLQLKVRKPSLSPWRTKDKCLRTNEPSYKNG